MPMFFFLPFIVWTGSLTLAIDALDVQAAKPAAVRARAQKVL
ncbi:MAG TPA: hypothetical protein VG986_06275 [Pseudolabrys sp.]|nr:hypothetical protein [Pseudolabrys sp.]